MPAGQVHVLNIIVINFAVAKVVTPLAVMSDWTCSMQWMSCNMQHWQHCIPAINKLIDSTRYKNWCRLLLNVCWRWLQRFIKSWVWTVLTVQQHSGVQSYMAISKQPISSFPQLQVWNHHCSEQSVTGLLLHTYIALCSILLCGTDGMLYATWTLSWMFSWIVSAA